MKISLSLKKNLKFEKPAAMIAAKSIAPRRIPNTLSIKYPKINI